MNFAETVNSFPPSPKGCIHEIKKLLRVINDIAYIRCEGCLSAWTTYAILPVLAIGVGNKFRWSGKPGMPFELVN